MRMNTIIEELDRSSKTIAPEKLQEVIVFEDQRT